MALADVSNRSITGIVSLTGRTAVVTGAAWGLGKATVVGNVRAGVGPCDGGESAGFVCRLARGGAAHDRGRQRRRERAIYSVSRARQL